MAEYTTVRVTRETKDRLKDRQSSARPTHNDVIEGLLDADESADSADENGTGESAEATGRLPCPATDTALAAVQELDGIPGAGERLDERQCALAIVYDYLQEHGSATSGELRERGYHEATAYADASSWWGNAGTEFLRQLPGVVSPGQGGSTWTYSG